MEPAYASAPRSAQCQTSSAGSGRTALALDAAPPVRIAAMAVSSGATPDPRRRWPGGAHRRTAGARLHGDRSDRPRRRDRVRAGDQAAPSFRAGSATSRRPATTACEIVTMPRASVSPPRPSSWKRHLYPPATTLWRARRDEHGALVFEETAAPPPRYAFLGVRACELAAILVQDRVFATGVAPRPHLCCAPHATCSSSPCIAGRRRRSASARPWAPGRERSEGFDLAHHGAARQRGAAIRRRGGTSRRRRSAECALPRSPGDGGHRGCRDAVTDASDRSAWAGSMDTRGLPELLQRNLEHPRWDDVAARCLSCGNCTMACPTCFCSDDVERRRPTAHRASRVREWASCFSRDFSYIHGGTVRPTVRSRYRQWMTHKLGTWWEQFGTSGCVGCGRCIAWCPVGIDITEEAAAIRATDGAAQGHHAVNTIADELAAHRFFAGMDRAASRCWPGAARNVVIPAGARSSARAAMPTPSGRCATDGSRSASTTPGPRHGRPSKPCTPATSSAGRGCSPPTAGTSTPMRWTRCTRWCSTPRACAQKCAADPALGFDLAQRFARVLGERLHAARLQLLDLYGTPIPTLSSRRDRR